LLPAKTCGPVLTYSDFLAEARNRRANLRMFARKAGRNHAGVFGERSAARQPRRRKRGSRSKIFAMAHPHEAEFGPKSATIMTRENEGNCFAHPESTPTVRTIRRKSPGTSA